MMLVCKTWNNAGGRPSLWSWVKITSWPQLRLKRLQGARELTIKSRELKTKGCWQKLLRAIHQHPSIKKINFGALWLTTETELLAHVLAKIEEIKVNSKDGTKYVLDTVLQRSNNLKRLVVWDFDHVDPAHLATALNKIEVLDVRLSSEQANLLFKTMKDDGTSIRSLSLEFFDPLSELEPKYLFAAFEKFELAEFWECGTYQDVPDVPRDVMTTFSNLWRLQQI